MTYKHKNECRPNGICWNYQGHKKSQEQRLKGKSKSNFPTKDKTRVCDSKTRT
jgi:hypothetical protein